MRKKTYPKSTFMEKDPLSADEPREPGVEFLDDSLGNKGGRFMCWRELLALSISLSSSRLVFALFINDEIFCPLFGRVE